MSAPEPFFVDGEIQRGAASPVFIGGLSGTGKTALRLALTTDPSISITRKSYLWPTHLGHRRVGRRADALLEAIASDRRSAVLDGDLAEVRKLVPEGPLRPARAIGLFHESHARQHGCQRWGDQYGPIHIHARDIAGEYPDARFIHLVRDPRDHWSSGRRWGAFGRLLADWTASTRAALELQDREDLFYRVWRFEDLMARPESTLSEICAFAGLALRSPMVDVLRDELAHVSGSTGSPCPPSLERPIAAELRSLGYRQTRGDGVARSVRVGVEASSRVWFLGLAHPLVQKGTRAWSSR